MKIEVHAVVNSCIDALAVLTHDTLEANDTKAIRKLAEQLHAAELRLRVDVQRLQGRLNGAVFGRD